MRIIRSFIIALVCALVAGMPVRALAIDTQPDLQEAQAACLTDAYGNILYDRNAEQELPMASITKVMTAMVTLDSGIPLSTPVHFVEQEYQEDAQVTGYKTGDLPSLDELLKVTLIYSGNDAATNVAMAVAGSTEAFVSLMNKKAAELGMAHTHFANPHGLEEDGHYSCAKDLCTMGRYALEHYPLIREIVKMRSITIAPSGTWNTFESTDHLMEYYDGLLGIKTGATESGTSFLGAANRHHTQIYSCVLCCETGQGRFDDSETLLDWGFSLYPELTFARQDLTYRTAAWQDGFWLKCPVKAEYDVSGWAFCEGSIKAKSAMYAPGDYVAPASIYGTTVWSQNGRHVESATYKTSQVPVKAKAWNPFIAPVVQENVEEVV